MIPDFLRRPDPQHPLAALRMRVRTGLLDGDTAPHMLNEDTPYEEPLTLPLALEWAERLAEVLA